MEPQKYILASSSPRRNELMAWLGLDFESKPAMINEENINKETPLNYVERLAKEKAEEIGQKDSSSAILAADTIVVFEDNILGKPETEKRAFEMLKMLAGNNHQVITAIHVIMPSSVSLSDVCISNVEMRKYSDTEIRDYVDSGDPMDKAGGYAIQNSDFHPVVNFMGCFASVMGFPFCHFERNLRSIDGYNCLPTSEICQKHLKYQCPIYEKVLAGENVG